MSIYVHVLLEPPLDLTKTSQMFIRKETKVTNHHQFFFWGRTASSLRPYGRSGQIICIGAPFPRLHSKK